MLSKANTPRSLSVGFGASVPSQMSLWLLPKCLTASIHLPLEPVVQGQVWRVVNDLATQLPLDLMGFVESTPPSFEEKQSFERSSLEDVSLCSTLSILAFNSCSEVTGLFPSRVPCAQLKGACIGNKIEVLLDGIFLVFIVKKA